MDIVKVNQAEKERDNSKREYLHSEKEILKAMQIEKERVEIETLARTVKVFEEHYDFFSKGITKMKDLIPEVLEYRNVVEQRSKDFEETNKISLGELLAPKSTKLLYTSPFTQHETEGMHIDENEILRQDPRKRALEKLIFHERTYVNNLQSISNVIVYFRVDIDQGFT